MKLHHLRALTHEICPVGRPAFVVEGDADFEVDDELARSLLEQTDNYGPADEASTALLAQITAAAAVDDDERKARAAAAVAEAEDALATARAEAAALETPAPTEPEPKPAPRGRRRQPAQEEE